MFKLDQIIRSHKQIQHTPRKGGPPIQRVVWERAVGSRIAMLTQPIRLERGVLTVRVSNTSWANELSLLSDDIRRQLQREGVRVDSLRFAVGKLDIKHVQRKAVSLRAVPPQDIAAPTKVQEQAQQLEEGPLKDAVEHAAATALWMAAAHRATSKS